MQKRKLNNETPRKVKSANGEYLMRTGRAVQVTGSCKFGKCCNTVEDYGNMSNQSYGLISLLSTLSMFSQ